MNQKAQAGLEYLVTYGWALILIAVVIGVLVFILSSPASDVTFSSSDPTKILMKAGTVTGTDAEIKIQNITGGEIEITSVSLTGGYSSCSLNEEDTASITSSSPVPVMAGGEIFIECINVSEASGTISIDYTDYAGLQRNVDITARGTAGGPGEPTDYIAYYKFEEGEGTSTADSSGNGNNGLFQGSLTWEGSDCPSGKCLIFSWGNYVGVPYHSIFDMSTTVTIMAWVKVTSFGFWRTVAAKDNDSYPEYWFGFGNNNRHAFMINPGDASEGDRYYVYADTVILDSDWHHLAAVYNGTDVRVYLDGVLDNTPEAHSDTIYSGSGLFNVGYTRRWNKGFDGGIDEVKLYNRALSAAEVCSACGPTCTC